MSRVTLYSRSGRSRTAGRPRPTGQPAQVDGPDRARDGSAASGPVARPPVPSRPSFYDRHHRLLLIAALGLIVALLVALQTAKAPVPRQITQEDIDAAVRHSLETKPLPSQATKAYEAIRPSVVRVRGLERDEVSGEDTETGIGTGVVIVDKGVILTNLHVVAGAKRVQVVFADGLESDARIIGVQAENDLAVLQAQKIPDDLFAATLRSTGDLAVGDYVVAVGFPFGIGPSASAGVVSGLKREFRSPEGERLLTNLIQFDAAVNPGSSGGPLVTAEGEVVGIVTAILNPSDQRVFIGIGFAVPIESAASAVGMPPF
jgi:S1-C subfamily serine protease